MAQKFSLNPIADGDYSADWGNDSNVNLPYSGENIQKFIKDELRKKYEQSDVEREVANQISDVVFGKGNSNVVTGISGNSSAINYTYRKFDGSAVTEGTGTIDISKVDVNDRFIAVTSQLSSNYINVGGECTLFYGFAITDTCPYFYFSDLIVGETTCDGKKKMYEYMDEIRPVHVMQLPQETESADSFSLWRNEVVRLKERIEKELNVTITDEDLKRAIASRNEERQAIKDFYELSKLSPPPMTGLELLTVLYGTTFKTDQREKIDSLKAITKNLKDEYDSGVRKVKDDAPRILVTGCPIGGATEKVIKLIEEAGAVVVCYENCTGVKGNDELVDETIEPYDAIARKYLNVACSCMSPNDKRIELLDRLVDEYKADGVIDIILQACHTYNVETFRIKNFINDEKDKPYMSVETDYSQSDIGQLRTRISAFIEML